MLKLLFLLAKAAKLAPFLKTGGTMLLSIVVYAFIFGWWYAVGFVLLMLVHELGHYVVARREGLDVGVPTFIPFVGAWIQLREQPLSVEQEARIAFGGPFVGTAGALVVLLFALQQKSLLLLALANAGFFINLFNLVPVTPFDGGRVVAILSPKIWFVGVPILLGLFFAFPSPMFLMILILLAPTVFTALRAAWRGEVPAQNPRYYEVPLHERVRYAAYYLMLVGFLCVMTWRTHDYLESLRRGVAA